MRRKGQLEDGEIPSDNLTGKKRPNQSDKAPY